MQSPCHALATGLVALRRRSPRPRAEWPTPSAASPPCAPRQTKLVAKLTDPKAKASTRPREGGLCKACGERRPAAAEMRATTDVVEALLRRHADAEAAVAALRADTEGAAGLRATAAALQARLLLLEEEEARAAEEVREAARCEAEDAAKKAAKARAGFRKSPPLSDGSGASVARPACLKGASARLLSLHALPARSPRSAASAAREPSPCGPPRSSLTSHDERLSRTTPFACQAHELVVARLRAEVGFRAEAEAEAARAVAAVATLEEEKRSATERVAALEAEAARRELETAAAAREAEVRGMCSSR